MSAASMPRRIHIIGCGVLAADLKHAARKLGMDPRLRFLPGGLHSEPTRLREALQEAIDAASDAADADAIILGYGLCGRGTVDLRARDTPLVIPRVHDCIALFLGSDARYREQFAHAPGSYYLSAGWVEEQGDGGPAIRMGSNGPTDSGHDAYARLLQQYGEENADYVTAFMGSWKRNYTRSVFIDTGVGSGKDRYEAAARRLAETCGWRYERLDGTHDLIVKLLTAAGTTDEVLVVPPGQSTVYDAVRRRLDAAIPATPTGVSATGGRSRHAEPGRGDGVTLCAGIGLGIDAGGTYTDAVLYDFETRAVLASSKAPTTPRDPSLGVAEALGSLRHTRLREARLVCISTTLATNALVEQRGQPVGLLLMPPYGNRDASVFHHAPLAFIDGQLDIDGRELQPVDPAQVAAAARRLVERHDVAAFAVGGFAGHINPAHELAVKRAVIEATGLGVTCGHDLSDRLDYRVRAETAALNARIIPCLAALLDRLQPVLSAHGVEGTVMVVRSDGSLMSLQAAMERPLETMLSGPAASVAGAAWLAREPDALVVDVGGTTTDAAIVRNGQVRMLDSGATIGDWQTHIRALDLHTRGLGGDSEVRLDSRGGLHLGPRRIVPAAWLGARQPALAEAIGWLHEHTRDTMPDSEALILIACEATVPTDANRAADERLILDLLRERPRSLQELRIRLDRLHTGFVPLAGLEAQGAVFRCGLTPTDALHVTGQMDLWDRPAALALCALHGSLAGASGEAFARRIIDAFEIRLATEILCRQLGETMDIHAMESQPAARELIARGLGDVGGDPAFRIRFEIDIPIIGIGAPAACFVPAAAARLHARCIVPEHAGVANAIGAVTGAISLHRRVNIQPDDQGRFRITGMPDAPLFASIEEATAVGQTFLEAELTTLAHAAGATTIRLAIHVDDAAAPAADGAAVFISRILEGHVTGRPAI